MGSSSLQMFFPEVLTNKSKNQPPAPSTAQPCSPDGSSSARASSRGLRNEQQELCGRAAIPGHGAGAPLGQPGEKIPARMALAALTETLSLQRDTMAEQPEKQGNPSSAVSQLVLHPPGCAPVRELLLVGLGWAQSCPFLLVMVYWEHWEWCANGILGVLGMVWEWHWDSALWTRPRGKQGDGMGQDGIGMELLDQDRLQGWKRDPSHQDSAGTTAQPVALPQTTLG